MKIKKIKNISISAANGRLTPLDVYYPDLAAPLPILIFAHGFKGYKDWGQFPLMLGEFAAEGFCVLAMNFSHNGGTVDQVIDFPDLEAFSQNTYTKEQTDLQRLVDWCLSDAGKQQLANCDFENINLLGHSRGGSMVLLYAATDDRINKVVSWAAVADLIERLPNEEELKKWKARGKRFIPNARTKQNMPQSYAFVKDLLANKDRFEIRKAVKKLAGKQLIVHGKADESVVISHAERLKKWNTEAGICLISNATHTFGGKQPFESSKLPQATTTALKATLAFLKSD